MSKQCCTRRFWDVPGNSWFILEPVVAVIPIYDSSTRRLRRVKTTKSAKNETSEARANAGVRPGFSSAGSKSSLGHLGITLGIKLSNPLLLVPMTITLSLSRSYGQSYERYTDAIETRLWCASYSHSVSIFSAAVKANRIVMYHVANFFALGHLQDVFKMSPNRSLLRFT